MKRRVFDLLLCAMLAVSAMPVLAQGANGTEEGAALYRRESRQQHPNEMRRMRNLRLKEAVQAGDLSPDDARRLQHRPPPGARPDGRGEGGRFAPNGFERPPPVPPEQRNYWRDTRQKAQEQFQNE